jgi:hypothetical protein
MQVQTISRSPTTSVGEVADDFTSLEWLVIAIGSRDGSKPLQWSAFGRLLSKLLDDPPLPLASLRLEALRRTASLARHHGWTIPAVEVGAFLRAGWSEPQLDRLIEAVLQTEPCISAWSTCEAVDGDFLSQGRSEPRTRMEIFS